MANITAKTEDTSPTSSDLLYEVDVSDTTDNANGSDKKVTAANLITKAHGLSDGVVKVASGAMTSATAGTDYYAPGGTDVALADGGTGASTASTARTNLGLDPHATYKSKTDGTTAPTSTDDSSAGYSVGSLWVDVTNDKSYICVDSTASNAVWNDLTASAGGGISNVVEDTTPQLGGQLDVNGNAIGDGTNELITFTEDASAVNQVNIENEATGAGPIVSSAGTDTNIDLNLQGKGTGKVTLQDGTDATKRATVDVSAITTATTRTITMPDQNVDLTPDTGTYQGVLAEGAFADGDKTKLDGIEASADVTDATNVQTALGSLDVADIGDVTITTIASGEILKWNGTGWINNTLAEADIQDIPAEGAFVDGDKTKLDGIETGADVTDTTNVTSALASITIDAHSGVDTDKSKTPADGDVLTFDGTDWNAETPAAGGGGGQSTYDYIIGSGGDYATLNAWFADTPTAGDRLFINGDHTITATVDITTNDITIEGSGGRDSMIDIGTNAVTLTFSGTGVTCRNVGFEHGTEANARVQFTGGGGCLVDGIYMHKNASSTIDFKVSGAGVVKVVNSEFVNDDTTSGSSAYVQIGGTYTQFANNSVTANTGNTGNGMVKIEGTYNSVTGNQFICTDVVSTQCLIVYMKAGMFANNTIVSLDASVNATAFKTFANNVVVNGNHISGRLDRGVEIDHSDVVVAGNNVQATTVSGYAVHVDAGDDNVITGNRLMGFSEGIRIDSGSNRTTIVGNALNSNTTQINDSGTGTLYITATDSDPLNTT